MTVPLYTPILILFTSILSCHNNSNTYVPSITCWQGVHFLHAVIGILMAILFILFSYLFVSLDLFSNSNSRTQEIIKTSSLSDVKFFFGKTIIVLIYTFLNTTTENEHWIVIAVTLFISAFVFADYCYRRPYVNETMMKYYFAMTSLYCWSNVCLGIGKLLEKSQFDGALPLFLVGIPVILIVIYTSEPPNFELLIHHQKKKDDGVLHSILKLLTIIETREKIRGSQILFDGYVSLYEEKCSNIQCPLTQFLNHKSKDLKERNGYLYQHIETLFANSIMKFPTSSLLRTSFAFFLLVKLNKKNRALVELANAEKYTTSLQDQFKIYKYQTMILNFECLSTIDMTEEVKNNLEYKKKYNSFKNSIRKVSLLYIDFWAILLLSDQDNKDNLEKLNDIGKSITQAVAEINEQFEMLQKMKYNDKDTIICYSDFLMNVINDKDKGIQLRSSLNLIRDSNQAFQEESYHLNANSLSYSDEAQYFVLSSQSESFGCILNISLGLCSLFGYSKYEIIGKSYECLVPELFIKQHREIVQSKADELRKNTSNYYSYKEIHTQRNTFAINKSKYLIPIHGVVGIIPNELNDFSFIVKILNLADQNPTINSIDCFVLTNNDLIIQHFTPNSVFYLDLDSQSINSTIEITEYIKEFNEDFLNLMVDLEDKSPEKKLAVKLGVLKRKYSLPSLIIWKRNKREGYERQFKMTIIEQKMANCRFGFVFQFEHIKEMPGSNMPSFKSIKISKEKNSFLLGKIEKEFIPESGTKFNLDPVTMSYKWDNTTLNNQTENHAKYIENLQALALKKVNLTPVDKSSLYSNDESDSSSNSNDNSISVDNSNESQSNEEDSKAEQCKNEKPATKQKDDSYYKVNLSRIKFFIIDYQKQAIVEEDYDKTNQIELKMDENYKDRDNALSSEAKQKQKDAKSKQDLSVNQLSDEPMKESHYLNDQNEIMLKQIESSLNLKESQPTIIRLQQVTLGVALFMLGIGVAFIVVLIDSYQSIFESTFAVQNTYDIIRTMITGQYYVRQITLMNNDDYTLHLYSKEQKFIDIKKELLELFNVSTTKMNQIVTTKMRMSNDAKYIFNQKTIPVYIIQDDEILNVNSFELNVKVAFIEANTALFHIAILDLETLITTHKDVHFYLRNGMNDIFNEMNNLNIVFLKELKINLRESKLLALIPFVLSPVVLLISYFLLNYYHMAVLNRKDSYLEVFFKIGKAIIQSSLENCEYFNKKIQNDSMTETVSGDDPTDFDMGEINQKETNPMNNAVSFSKKKFNQLTKETKLIKKQIAAVVGIIMVFFILVFAFFINYLNLISVLIDTYQHVLEYQINNCCLINYMREYFYDRTVPIYFIEEGTDYLETALTNVYALMKEKEVLITSNIHLYDQSFITLYKQMTEGNLCRFGEDHFALAKTDCDHFLNGAAKYGMTVLLSAFIEEIRFVRNEHNIDMKTRIAEGLTYNMTLYGTKAYYKNWPDPNDEPERYQRFIEYSPIRTLNYEANFNINAVYLNFMLPAFSEMISNMKSNIENTLTYHKTVFLSALISYLCIVLLFYLFIIIPFIQSLNQTVSNTIVYTIDIQN